MNKAKLIEALNMAIEAIEDDSTTVAQNVEANVAENKETPKKTAPKPVQQKPKKVETPKFAPDDDFSDIPF